MSKKAVYIDSNILMDSMALLEEESNENLDNLGCGDYRNGLNYYIFSRSVKEREIPFVLRSDRKLLHVVGTEGDVSKLSDGTKIKNLQVPEFRNWSDSSIRSFVKGESDSVSLQESYSAIKKLLGKSLFADDLTLSFFALCVVGSYFVNQASALPMIHIRGGFGSAKSFASSLLLRLSYNGSNGELPAIFGKASESSIFRSCALSRGVVSIDDIEIINSERSTNLRVGFLTSYKRSTAIQSLTERGKRKSFNLFQFKILTSINEAEPVLKSRIIEVHMRKAPEGYLPSTITEDAFSSIRDSLHIAAMTDDSITQVRQAIEQAESDRNYSGRFGEITAILRGIAKVCGAEQELRSYLDFKGSEIKNAQPNFDKIIMRLFNEGYKHVSIAQIQSELLLMGYFISSNRLGVELQSNRMLTHNGVTAIHGHRTSLYGPSRRAKKLISKPLKRMAREHCLQGTRKVFDSARCDGCAFKNVCPILKAKQEAIVEAV